jgi:hypothetical protein
MKKKTIKFFFMLILEFRTKRDECIKIYQISLMVNYIISNKNIKI